MDIFKFLSDKDIFSKYYKGFLSQRLIQSKSLNEDYERSFVEKLKRECGPFYTSKIEIMFKDISISKQLVVEFKNMLIKYQIQSQNSNLAPTSQGNIINDTQLNFEFDVSILTMGNWPIQETSESKLPEELNKWKTYFEKYYITKNPGRNLTWVLSHGTAEIRGIFRDKKKEFIMTTYQMCIILQYNDQLTFSFRELENATMIPSEELKKQLQAMTAIKLLIRESRTTSENIGENDTFALNEDFTHKNYKIKIPIKSTKDSIPDAHQAMEGITIERKYALEACIVRIMKSRKRMEHSVLIEEVIRLTAMNQFIPDIQFIKSVIETLIGREYIDRAPENRNQYIYIS